MQRAGDIIMGAVAGGLVSFWITSSEWIRASARHFWEWDSGLELVGAIANLATAAAAVIGLPLIIYQLRETRRQTRVALGDEDPDVDVVEHVKTPGVLVVRVTNWNRRGVLIDAIGVSGIPLGILKIADVEIDDEAVRPKSGTNPKFAEPLYLFGHTDRGGKPSVAQIDVACLQDIPGSEIGWTSDTIVRDISDVATISVTMRMVGHGEPFTCTSRVIRTAGRVEHKAAPKDISHGQ